MRMLSPLSPTSIWPENRLSLVPMGRLFSDFEEMFEQPDSHLSFSEGDECFFARFDLPGVKKDDLQIEMQDGVLTVTAERKDSLPFASKSQVASKKMSHTLSLPRTGDITQMKAVLEDGVLTIAIPKAEIAKPRKVEIETDSSGFKNLFGAVKSSDALVK